MANTLIPNLNEISSSQISLADLTVVVDVNSPVSETGETKKIDFYNLSQFILSQTSVLNESNVNLNDVPGIPLDVENGGTGRINLTARSVIVGNGTGSVKQISGTSHQFLGVTNVNEPDFITGPYTSSTQVNYPEIQNKPDFLSSSNQLPPIYSSSNQISFAQLGDTQDDYIPNSVVVVSSYNNSLRYITESIFSDSGEDYKKAFANGVYYFNGDIREKLYANPNPGLVYSGSPESQYSQNFLHSNNLFLDKEKRLLFFTRGCWPRRRGVNSSDLKGWTWRELNDSSGSQAEAVCRTRDDGQEFTVLANLYTSTIGDSLPNSVKNISGSCVVSEPVAVVYHRETEKLFVACRNDHNNSIIYRMNATGSQSEIESSAEVWVEFSSGILNIDCLELGTIPQAFFNSTNPLQDTDYLFVGSSPDWSKVTNKDNAQNSGIYRFPVTGTPIGKLKNLYPSAYTIHRWWGSGYNTRFPNMGETGIKSLKLFIPRNDNDQVEWKKGDSNSLVKKGDTRLFVVHSGAQSRIGLTSLGSVPVGSYTRIGVSIISASTFPTVPQIQPTQANPVLPGSSWSTTFQPVVPILVPEHGPLFSPPLNSSVVPPTDIGFYDNEQFGGHGIFELLIGDVADNNPNGLFDGLKDYNRPYKTWRLGVLQNVNETQTGLNLGYNDPGYPTTENGVSGIGVARGQNLSEGDRLFISTSPKEKTKFNGLAKYGEVGCRGICKIETASCDLYSAKYILEHGDGQTGLGQVMVIPCLFNSVDNESTSFLEMGQQGLQQLAIDPIEKKFYVTDFFGSKYYKTFLYNSSSIGYQNTFPYPVTPTPNTIYTPATSIPSGTPFAGGVDANTDAIYWPTNPIYPGAPQGVPGYFYPLGWSGGPAAQTYTGQNNAPVSITPSSNYFGPGDQFGGGAYYFTPSYYPKATFPSTANQPNPYLPGYGQPAENGNPAGPKSLDGETYAFYNVLFSEFGAIYEGNLWEYSRGINGQRIFDNQNPQIGYSRPCGLVLYSEGPMAATRLVYTNGENNFELLSSSLDGGTKINGLSKTFTKDGVLAQGRNILSISDRGPSLNGGLIINFVSSSKTSDYLVYAYNNSGYKFKTGQSHNNNPLFYSGSIDLVNARNDASTYFGKNRNSFRLVYDSSFYASQSMDVIYFGILGGSYNNLC